NRSNPRQYLASIGSMPDMEVVFQRAADIPPLVQDGDAALGITGFDILAEHRGHSDEEADEDDYDDDIIVLERNLGYGHCRLVVDLTETGTTLRENHLKLLDDGIVLRSQACLIANARLLNQSKGALRMASIMLELIDAHMQAHNRSMLTAHLQVEGADEIQRI